MSSYEYEPQDPLVEEVKEMLEHSGIPFDYISAAMTDKQLRKRPLPRELVPGWFPRVGPAGLWAQPGNLKTHVGSSVAMATRRGHRWQNRYKRVTRKGGVIFWEGEAVEQIILQQDAIERKWPLVNTELSPQWTLDETPALDTVEGVCAVVRTTDEFVKRLTSIGDELALMIFDPLPNFISGDELKDGKIKAVRSICWLAERFQSCVLAIDQSNAVGERARGHDIFRQMVYTYARIEKVQEDMIAIVQEKKKFGQEIALRLWITPVDLGYTDDDGESVTDVVLEYDDLPNPAYPLSAWDYEKEKEKRIQTASVRKRQSKTAIANAAVDKALMLAFRQQKEDTGQPWFESQSALFAMAQIIDDGLSDAALYKGYQRLLLAKKVEEDEERGDHNRIGVRWVGEE
jgi:AAA domain